MIEAVIAGTLLFIISFQHYRWKRGMEERVALTCFLIVILFEGEVYKRQQEGIKKFVTDVHSSGVSAAEHLLVAVPKLALELGSFNALNVDNLVKQFVAMKD